LWLPALRRGGNNLQARGIRGGARKQNSLLNNLGRGGGGALHLPTKKGKTGGKKMKKWPEDYSSSKKADGESDI